MEEVDLSQVDLRDLLIFETVNNMIFDEQHKKYVLLRHPFFQRKITLKNETYGFIETVVYKILYFNGTIGGCIDDESVLSQDDDGNLVLDSACLAFGSKLMGKGIVIGGNIRVFDSYINANDISIRDGRVRIVHSNITITDPYTITTGLQIVEGNKASARVGDKGITIDTVTASGFSSIDVRQLTPRTGRPQGVGYGLGAYDLKDIKPIPKLGKINIDLINRINIYLKENGLGSNNLDLRNKLPFIAIPSTKVELGVALSEGRKNIKKKKQHKISKPKVAPITTTSTTQSTNQPAPTTLSQPNTQQQSEVAPTTIQSQPETIILDPDDSFIVSFDGETHLVQRIQYSDESKGGYAEDPSNIDGGLVLDNGIVYGNVVIGKGTIISGNAIVCGTGRLTRPFEFTKNRIVMRGDNLYDIRKE